jgi:hypothetical protein
MSKPSVLRARALRASLMAVAASVIALGASAPATARSADTFSGTCSGLEGWASWPEQPMTVLPVDMLLRARLSGGECSGTLNGRDVQSRPAAARARLRGVQSCGGGATTGRFKFELAGRTFTGKMTYRRVGPRVTALWEGDGGGGALVVVHAQIGLVGEDDPLAATPVAGPLIADRVSSEEALRRCADEGLSRMPVAVDQIVASSLSG